MRNLAVTKAQHFTAFHHDQVSMCMKRATVRVLIIHFNTVNCEHFLAIMLWTEGFKLKVFRASPFKTILSHGLGLATYFDVQPWK